MVGSRLLPGTTQRTLSSYIGYVPLDVAGAVAEHVLLDALQGDVPVGAGVAVPACAARVVADGVAHELELVDGDLVAGD